MESVRYSEPSPEAFSQWWSVKTVFLEISQTLQENTYARVSCLIKLQPWSWSVIKNVTLAQLFPVNFAKFLRTPLDDRFCSTYLWSIFAKRSILNVYQGFKYVSEALLIQFFLSFDKYLIFFSWQLLLDISDLCGSRLHSTNRILC